jgi:uncharacterized secreted protein with C-terminal beta-propeller domain
MARLRIFGMSLVIGMILAGCGGSDDGPLDTDYSKLEIAESRETPLVYAQNVEQLLRPLRNGVRIMTEDGPVLPAATAVTAQGSTVQSPRSDTTVQVDGVAEADSVKYDGRYVYSTHPQLAPAAATPGAATVPQWSRNVLDIIRTQPATAGFEYVTHYSMEGQTNISPQLYLVRAQTGTTDYVAAVSQDYRGWLAASPPVSSLVVQPDLTILQVLDVHDPLNVSQAWSVEIDGWLNASRMIGDTLYLVTTFRPRVANLELPADTQAKKEANERRIRSTGTAELLPGYRENGGARRALVTANRCLVTPNLAANEGYTDLVVISAVNLRTRQVRDVNCLSTNVNGVYVSQNTLYVAGTAFHTGETNAITVLHKFALGNDEIQYRATGAVIGTLSWSNPSYFMDEFNGDLRILSSSNGVHRLTVLRESNNKSLMVVSTLPNANRPAPIGKPNEAVYAVRFAQERAYVVTFKATDPLYVIGLFDPADPEILGQLEINGFAAYLKAVGAGIYLVSVGQAADASGQRMGVKVDLLDVTNAFHPQVLATETIGGRLTTSEALFDPHAIALMSIPGPDPRLADARLRVSLPIAVYDDTRWKYSGQHLFEISGLDSTTPELHFQGVIKTAESQTGTGFPPFVRPDRAVLDGDGVFVMAGEQLLSSLWQNVPRP